MGSESKRGQQIAEGARTFEPVTEPPPPPPPASGGIVRSLAMIGEDGPPPLVVPFNVQGSTVLANAIRQAAAAQFRTALLDGLEDLDRVHHWNGHVDSGDLAQLIEAVAAEVGRS